MKICLILPVLLLFICSTTVSCQSTSKSKELNSPVNQFKMKEQFPNQKTAFEKNKNEVNFFKPSGTKILKIDLYNSGYRFLFPDEMYSEHLIRINDFLYFSPSVLRRNYEFTMEGKGTGAGKFSTVNKFNELGLIETSKFTYPQEGRPKETKVKYLYNKFGQLLRIVENNETEVENIYDAVGNLLETLS